MWELIVPLVSECSEDFGGFVVSKPGMILMHAVETIGEWKLCADVDVSPSLSAVCV